ncbi:MAG: nitroreductase family deazaflavin-dependent oxidoreductase [Anaerolineae bacterium]
MSLWSKIKDRQRYINRAVVNPLTLSFAGRPGIPYAMIRHTGRHSGRPYTTPVMATPDDGGFLIPLPYGTDVDWVKNLQAEGGGLLVYQGNAYRVHNPKIVSVEAGCDVYSEWVQSLLVKVGAEHCLRLQNATPSPEPEAVYRHILASYPMGHGILMIVATALGFVLGLVAIRRLVRRQET